MAKDTLRSKLTPSMLNRATLQHMLATLNELIEMVKNNDPELNRQLGICWNWQNQVKDIAYPGADVYAFISTVGADWPESRTPGKREAYPVPGPISGSDLWQGEQLELRLSLMRYARKRLRDLLRRTPA